MPGEFIGRWPLVRLSQIAELSLGKMLDKDKNRGALRPYLANINVRWGSFDLQNLREMRFEEREFERYNLRSGDIALCEGGEPGRCALWLDDETGMMIQKALHRIRPMDGIDSHYLYYALAQKGSSGGFDEYLTGGGIKHLPGEQLAKVEVSIPPLDEQRRIAEVLRSVDEAITTTESINRQAETLWHGLTETLIWELATQKPDCVRPLGTAVRSSDYGVNVPLAIEAIGHPVLRMGNIQDGRIDLSDLKWGEVPAEDAEALALSEGDILFNRTNSRDLVGKVALVREPTDCLYASYIVRLSVDRAVADPYYLFAVMHSDRAQDAFKAIATPGVGQSNINPTNLKKHLVPLPELAVQRSIAAQIRSVEDVRVGSQRELEALEIIRKDLAASLLSGRVRVPT